MFQLRKIRFVLFFFLLVYVCYYVLVFYHDWSDNRLEESWLEEPSDDVELENDRYPIELPSYTPYPRISILDISLQDISQEEGCYNAEYSANSVNYLVTYKGGDVLCTAYSPSGKKFGFYFYTGDSSDYLTLGIMDVQSKEVKEVYHGNFWTSGWEWKTENEVIVRRRCGTYCLYAYEIDIDSGRIIDQYHTLKGDPIPTRGEP